MEIKIYGKCTCCSNPKKVPLVFEINEGEITLDIEDGEKRIIINYDELESVLKVLELL